MPFDQLNVHIGLPTANNSISHLYIRDPGLKKIRAYYDLSDINRPP